MGSLTEIEGHPVLAGPWMVRGERFALVPWAGGPWIVWQHPDGQWVTKVQVQPPPQQDAEPGEGDGLTALEIIEGVIYSHEEGTGTALEIEELLTVRRALRARVQADPVEGDGCPKCGSPTRVEPITTGGRPQVALCTHDDCGWDGWIREDPQEMPEVEGLHPELHERLVPELRRIARIMDDPPKGWAWLTSHRATVREAATSIERLRAEVLRLRARVQPRKVSDDLTAAEFEDAWHAYCEHGWAEARRLLSLQIEGEDDG